MVPGRSDAVPFIGATGLTTAESAHDEYGRESSALEQSNVRVSVSVAELSAEMVSKRSKSRGKKFE